jgi:ribosomal protein S18 acetylase RimI-like enzyme
MPDDAIHLVSAADFSIDELTAAYNQTRVDYMVPMPMNASRLAAYVQGYTVSLSDSLVARAGADVLGLAMLGVRPGRAWITRLGVLPLRRRRGTGESLVRGLLAAAERRGPGLVLLEVIKGNQPAYNLFHKLGFSDTRELLVLRRPPAGSRLAPSGEPAWLEAAEALGLLRAANLGCGCDHPLGLAWTNEVESFSSVSDTLGLTIDLGAEGRGWLVFRRQKFLLSHFVFHTQHGDPRVVGAALLSQLYYRYPLLDTFIENLPVGDPHYPALTQFDCIEVFRRIEMAREK